MGIGGKGVETFFDMEDRTLENMEEEWKGNFVDLTVMRGTKSVTPKHFVVNPIYGIPFYDCDSSDEEVEDKSEGVVITAIEDAREWLKNRKDKWRGWRGIGANYQHGDVVGSRFWEEEVRPSVRNRPLNRPSILTLVVASLLGRTSSNPRAGEGKL